MLDIGIQELVILMALALLVFGPDKLPDLGRRLGRAMREFRRASDEFRSTIETNLNISEEPPLPPSAAATATTEPVAASAGDTAIDPAAAIAPAGGATALAPSAGEPGESATPVVALVEPFCAQKGGRLLHRSACAWAARVPEGERIVLKTAAEGAELGLGACPVCDPKDGDLPA